MVVPALAIGGAIGVLLSGGFIWWELGRFASPQVPTTIFDERKLILAYTAGLFVGVPVSVVYLLFVLSLGNVALLGALVFLVALVGLTELAQYLALRSAYWRGVSGPFYALALRAGVGGILVLAVLTTYLGAPTLVGAGPAALTSLAVVALEITGALVTLAPARVTGLPRARPWAGILFGLAGFFLLGFGPIAGPAGGIGGAAVALVGSLLVYRRLRSTLSEIPAPGAERKPAEPSAPLAYGRTTGEGPPESGRLR